MKKLMKTLAMVLTLSLVISGMPTYAAPRNNSYSSSYSNKSWLGSFWDKLFGNDSKEESVEEPTNESTEESVQEPVEEPTDETELTLVEDESTVENGEMLRASTYALTTTSDTETIAETTNKVKYFPVTMYDYDASTINKATDASDNDLTVREGMYFTGGSPDYTKGSSTDMSAFEAGEYYIQNIRAKANGVGSWLYSVAEDTSIRSTTDKSAATVWTLVIENGEYYLMSGDKYLVVGTNGDTDGLTDTKTPIEISAFSGDASGVQLSQNGYYLCQWGSNTSIYYGGYNVANDGGNGMLFYPVDSDTPVTPKTGEETIVSGYEEWNRWDKASGTNSNGDLIYTGLVQKEFLNGQIKFNVNEGGIFDDNTTVKNIYEYVGLPFVFDTEKQVYTFDSDENGAYFADTDGDGDADPQSGTADAPYNMYFAEGNPQPMPTDLSVGDGSTNAWFPYNAQSSYTTSQVNYHMGMRADLPFSMTANGRVKSTDDESAPITFTFSGDDDVWVYIDGVLVVDLGGIHNRLDVTIDFAANTVTYSEENAQDNNNNTASYNDPDFAMTQKLFRDSEGKGLIDMTRDAFALTEEHEMSVFYLERGEGTSNCRIEFNLPMNDTVLVTKDATQSWSENNQNDENEGVTPLTAAEQAVVDNIDFGFTLYKKNAGETTYTPVANTNYYLIGKNVEGTVIGNTDANGHFYLKNGQSAKFITDIPMEGVTYYVVEDKVPDGFVTPDFNYDGEAAYGFSYLKDDGISTDVEYGNLIPEQEIATDATINKSYEVTVKGSVEANDSVEFICSNFLDAELPNPTALSYEDIIVIDYGLPVQIDPLANDVFRGDSIEIVYVGGDGATLTESEDANGIVQAEWTEGNACHSGIVALNEVDYNVDGNKVTRDTLTYTLNKQLTEVEVLNYIIKVKGSSTNAAGTTHEQYDYAIGKVYIVPATTMYYEENFSDLVTFTGDGWKGEGNGTLTNDEYVSAYQEPGVVGTVSDSTYGSDVAYLSDSKDSNGTSYKGDTTSKAIRFSYTFTGTGTSFFARTSADTGYMQVKLYEGEGTSGEQLNLTYRDTFYDDTNNSSEDADGTLYNIPVYTESDLHYGTYTVVATVAKAGTKGAGGEGGSGNEFYLDGIRIMQPLNESNETVINEETGETITDKALGAYATDGEANMDVVTLRQKMITDAELGTTPWNFVVLTDTDGEIVTVEDYTSIGPKEEVYLDEGQTVSFSLKYWETDGLMLYLGMKTPFGSATAQVGQTTYNLANATDCYYNITKNYSSLVTKYEQAMDEDGNLLYTDENGNQVYEDEYGYLLYVSDNSEVPDDVELTPVDDTNSPYYVATFTITANDSIVSLTNIKVTGNHEFVIVEDENIDINGDENVDGDEYVDGSEGEE